MQVVEKVIKLKVVTTTFGHDNHPENLDQYKSSLDTFEEFVVKSLAIIFTIK